MEEGSEANVSRPEANKYIESKINLQTNKKSFCSFARRNGYIGLMCICYETTSHPIKVPLEEITNWNDRDFSSGALMIVSSLRQVSTKHADTKILVPTNLQRRFGIGVVQETKGDAQNTNLGAETGSQSSRVLDTSRKTRE
ncbi:hypothetical protein J6590_006705 [Homalodisca vitripennis]|nr:hypothetical protein J6590_006705 [Homalodisca vitripennis]